MTQTTLSPPLMRPATGFAWLCQLPGIYAELAKAKLSALVVATTAVGFIVGSGMTGGGIGWLQLLWTVTGTSLAAGGANALNQVWERRRDAIMRRTHARPLPSGRIGPLHALAFGVLAGGWGVTLLAAMVDLAAAGLALFTLLLYVLVYTPMKTRSTLNTMVGSVVGAVPPMIGWVAATGSLSAGAWVLGAILFVWQIPHFLALAWLYRKDYEAGGYRMLPIIDPSGYLTGQAALLWSVALLPLGVVAAQVGMTGWVFAVASLGLTLWMVKLAWELAQKRTEGHARRLFIASVIYLPLLMAVMVVDRVQVREVHWGAAPTPAAVYDWIEQRAAEDRQSPVSHEQLQLQSQESRRDTAPGT